MGFGGSFVSDFPSQELLNFFGDVSAPALFENAASALERLGGTRVQFDFNIFMDAAQLLEQGLWVAERLAAIEDFAAAHPNALHPITAQIILKADSLTAVSAFQAIYRLAALTRRAEAEWRRMDFMPLSTACKCYTHEEVEANPFFLNTNLGYYTNFVNLLDLAAVAVPAGTRAAGMPFGATQIGPGWSDEALLETADALHAKLAHAPPSMREPAYCPEGYVPLAVCGAHLSGQPLNYQLRDALLSSSKPAARRRITGSTPYAGPCRPNPVWSDRSRGRRSTWKCGRYRKIGSVRSLQRFRRHWPSGLVLSRTAGQ